MPTKSPTLKALAAKPRTCLSLFEDDPDTGKRKVKPLVYSTVPHPTIILQQSHIDAGDQCSVAFLKKQSSKKKGKKYKGNPDNCVISQMFTDHFNTHRGLYGEFVGVNVTPASVRIEFKDRVVVYGTNPTLNKAIKAWDNHNAAVAAGVPNLPASGWTLPAGEKITLLAARLDNLARHSKIKGVTGGKKTVMNPRGMQGRKLARLR